MSAFIPSVRPAHTFSLPILNGVIEGVYEVTMSIVDTTTGQMVWQATSDNGPFDLVPISEPSRIGP